MTTTTEKKLSIQKEIDVMKAVMDGIYNISLKTDEKRLVMCASIPLGGIVERAELYKLITTNSTTADVLEALFNLFLASIKDVHNDTLERFVKEMKKRGDYDLGDDVRMSATLLASIDSALEQFRDSIRKDAAKKLASMK